MKNSRENTPKMFNLADNRGVRDEKNAPIPPAAEADDIFSDLQISEPPDAGKTSGEKEPAAKNRAKMNYLELGEIPDEPTIKKTAAEYAENQPPKNETAGFKAAGERIRIVVPDDPTDPERVARVTQLGLRAIKTIDKNPDQPKKK